VQVGRAHAADAQALERARADCHAAGAHVRELTRRLEEAEARIQAGAAFQPQQAAGAPNAPAAAQQQQQQQQQGAFAAANGASGSGLSALGGSLLGGMKKLGELGKKTLDDMKDMGGSSGPAPPAAMGVHLGGAKEGATRGA